MKFKHILIGCALLLILLLDEINAKDDPVWRWECQKSYCQKKRVTPATKDAALNLAACRLFCHDFAGLWPQPTGEVAIGNELVLLNHNSIDVTGVRKNSSAQDLIKGASRRFKNQIETLASETTNHSDGKSLSVHLVIENDNDTSLTLSTDESYSLKIEEMPDKNINATIEAKTFFGARHGLETLSQLILYDDIRDEVQVPKNALIIDRPIYPHRGLLLDTSRNYISVASIKRTIDGMASSKLNTFHWHLTDVTSFPFVSMSRPELSKIGAYSQKQVYTPEDVASVIQWAKERGVKVLPELDAPAHVGEGWQDTGFVACFNKRPWQSYCVGPPCGQFDPSKTGLYDALEDLYKDMLEQFDPDMFHMGGDEVSTRCWNSTESIVNWMANEHNLGRTERDFMKVWNIFQSQALERLDKQSKKQLPVILWTSTLTQKEYVELYLPKDRYIIQVWTRGRDPHIQDLLQRGYKLILSNYDALYLDCGFAGWVADGVNWCSPYIGWQKFYQNSPKRFAGSRADQMLGGEAALWTEQVDDGAIDSRVWPRTAAMAERLWAEPSTSWREAEQRMLVHRERLIKSGIASDALEPEWCSQNEENCPTSGVFNKDEL